MDLNGLVDKVKELQGRNETLSRQLERSGREHTEHRAALQNRCTRQEAEIGRLLAEAGAAARERDHLRAEVARLLECSNNNSSEAEPELNKPEAEPLNKPEAEPLNKPEAKPLNKPEAEPLNKPEAEPLKRPEAEPLNKPEAEADASLAAASAPAAAAAAAAAVVVALSSCPDLRQLLFDDRGEAADASIVEGGQQRRWRRYSLQLAPAPIMRTGRLLLTQAKAFHPVVAIPRCTACPGLEAESRNLRRELAARDARVAELSDALEALDTQCRRSDAAHAEKLDDLSKQLTEAAARVTHLRDQLSACKSGMGDQLACLIRDRDQLQEGLSQLQGWYDSLLSARRDSADSMRQDLLEGIPTAVDELQVLVLKLKEDLIAERVNREHMESRFQSEAAFERQKLLGESEQLRQTQEFLQSETDRCDRLRSDLGRERSAREAGQAQLAGLQEKSREVVANLRASEAELKARAARLETDNTELRHRVTCLQTELHNSESVQKDFVELSQSLQVQLENLRQQENQVRWQFLEDAADCPACGRAISLAVRPRRCLHCVRIFCHDCTAKTVASGPKQRVANVCDFCHTLVVKDAVPYFSVKAPSSGGGGGHK